MLIGSKIKLLRKQNGLTQSELCGNLINRVVLSKIENNKMSPSLEQLEYISIKLNTPIVYFIDDTNTDCFNMDNINHNFIYDLYKSKKYIDIINLLQSDVEKNNAVKDPNKYYYTGMSFYEIGIFNNSKKYLTKYTNEYAKLSRELQSENILYFATALNTLFKISMKNNNLKRCRKYLETAKKYICLYNYTESYTSFCIYSNLALLYLKDCRYNNIIKLLENFLSLDRNYQYINILPDMYLSLSIACYNVNEYEKSIKYIKKAIYLFLFDDNEYEAGLSYLNYTNALRYCSKFTEAFRIIDMCKCDYKNYTKLYQRFLIQEMILYFNIKQFDSIIKISDSIDLNILPKMSQCNFYYIMCSMAISNGDISKASKYLTKFENYFFNRNYLNDLKSIYTDFYKLSNDERFLAKSNLLDIKNSRRNIL